VTFKSCPLPMPHSTLLEKIDTAIKDSITKHLIGHLVREWQESGYHTANVTDRDEMRDAHALHTRNVLWVRMSKDAGISDILQTAYDKGASFGSFRQMFVDLYRTLENLEKERTRRRDTWVGEHGEPLVRRIRRRRRGA
jgi:hypothetical protein